ncbi:HNH endonuclease [Virgisporangium aurantiacum]|uniref:HNH endonuclease n=2 Tax=Virgisporangium aurantiacum TaxID=175570 RepID=A0A8J4DZK3_9ACTN|nr:HNH endonuclease [Virgisporangium aurantiacum]
MLAAAAELLDGEDLDSATDAALATQLRGLWVAICRLQAQLSRRVAVFDERGAAARDGARGIRGWLRHRLRLDAVEAGRQATVAAALVTRPAAAAAYLRGEISAEHLAAIDEAGWLLGDDAMDRGVERILLQHARREPPGRLRRLSRRFRERGGPQEAVDAFRRVRAHRFLDVVRAGTGAVNIRGQLDVSDGELLLAALRAVRSIPPARGPDAAPGSLPPPETGTPELSVPDGAEAPERARADALVALCRAVLRTNPAEAGRGLGDRARVVVTVPLETLRASPTGDALLGSGEPVPAAVARRLACDARVLPAVLGGAGEVLDIGAETETVTQGLRRAVELRDRGCRFPGCDLVAAECEAHHLVHWAQGGQSIVDNVALLCPYHHGLVHEGGWQITRDPYTGTVRARRPDGTRLDTVSPPPE